MSVSLRYKIESLTAPRYTKYLTPLVDWQFTLAMAAYDLVRLPKLFAGPVP
jgi:hypothetical protein